MHVMGYIKNSLDYGLTYYCDSEISPTAYVDADYGGCRDTRRSRAVHRTIYGVRPYNYGTCTVTGSPYTVTVNIF